MDYRVEKKYLVSDAELCLIRQRLCRVIPQDKHQTGDFYQIRSLYFDNEWDQCMDENESGIDQRKKYRIRTYDPSSPAMKLEIKEKDHGLTRKTSCPLTREEVDQIMAGRLPVCPDQRKALNLLKLQMRCSIMRPKVIISYERTAFVYPAGNVRITFDRNISASRFCSHFFEDTLPGNVPVLPAGVHILEVKYDEFLPDFIARQLEISSLNQTAFSKYYLGRLAVAGEFPIELPSISPTKKDAAYVS